MSFRRIIRGRALGKDELFSAVESRTSSFTLTKDELNKSISLTGDVTVTIPSGISQDGDRIDFVNAGTGVITFAGSGVTVNSVDAAVTIDTQWAGATFLFTSPSAGVLIGKLA